nr:immunoglobulin light chain junction region [Macaca mulatta]
CLQYNRSPYSF